MNQNKKTENLAKTQKLVLITSLIYLAVGFVLGFLVKSLIPGSTGSVRKYTVPTEKKSTPPQQSVNFQKLENIKNLETQLLSDPKNTEAWAMLGHMYFDTNQFQKAINAYKKNLEFKPGDANIWTDMGVMYRRLGNSQEALNCFNKAIELDPTHQQSRFNKGIVLMNDLNKHNEAIKAWEKLIKINPSAKTPNGTFIKDLLKRYGSSKN